MRNRFFGLCLPPLLLCLFDSTLTLVGQSSQYWAGNYWLANERNPTFNSLLNISPWADMAGIAVWMGVFVGILLLLPDTLALIVSIAVTFGHTVGAATWLYSRFFRSEYGYQMCNALFLFTAILLGTSIRWGWQAAPAQQYHIGLKPILRWALIAVLFAVGVYLALWPRSVDQ
jgi:hypothetical protein